MGVVPFVRAEPGKEAEGSLYNLEFSHPVWEKAASLYFPNTTASSRGISGTEWYYPESSLRDLRVIKLLTTALKLQLYIAIVKAALIETLATGGLGIKTVNSTLTKPIKLLWLIYVQTVVYGANADRHAYNLCPICGPSSFSFSSVLVSSLRQWICHEGNMFPPCTLTLFVGHWVPRSSSLVRLYIIYDCSPPEATYSNSLGFQCKRARGAVTDQIELWWLWVASYSVGSS